MLPEEARSHLEDFACLCLSLELPQLLELHAMMNGLDVHPEVFLMPLLVGYWLELKADWPR